MEDIDKIDFSKYGNYKIQSIKNVIDICKKNKISEIFADNYYYNIKKKFFKLNISINILQPDNLFNNLELDTKSEFVDKYFNNANKIKIKSLNHYNNKTVLITGAGGSIGKFIF